MFHSSQDSTGTITLNGHLSYDTYALTIYVMGVVYNPSYSSRNNALTSSNEAPRKRR